MAVLKAGDRVEHVSDASLGVGVVRFVQEIAGDRSAFVSWGGATGVQSYTEAQLRVVEDPPEQLGRAGPGATVPFQLRVLGRWFEARHEQTGEITNQPFDMLPHQVVVTNRVLTSPPAEDGGRHWLIADDVGLGKTIEAGMILEVMRHRAGGALRCLVVAPAGLVNQWQVELAERFGRRFQQFDKADVNLLQDFDQVVASIHTLRQLLRNKAALDVHPWDLVIFDEAHHLTKPGVQMYDLARHLREKKKAKNTLFLTATPHSGNHDHFCNMLQLLRPDLVDRPTKHLPSLPDLPLAKMIIRNRKHLVTDAKGKKIFYGIAKAMVLAFQPTEAEIAFAEEVKNYRRHGYNEAGKLNNQRRSAVGFLMATFGKLASSSREALKSALQRRVKVLRGEQSELEGGDAEVLAENAEGGVGGATEKGASLIRDEVEFVEGLLVHLEALPGPDSKLEGFASGLERLVAITPDVKVLIFTEYRATQDVLRSRLAESFGKESVDTIHGSKKLPERKEVVRRFNEEDQPRFIVSTAAGGEGLNLQRRCHTIVNYDLPWNPNVLQQRIGRVYRYGQTKPVIVYNLKVETVSDAYADNKVYEYLEKKLGDVVDALAIATGEGKEDLLGDVLGQAAVVGLSLEELHQIAIEQGERRVKETIDIKAKHLQEIMENRDDRDVQGPPSLRPGRLQQGPIPGHERSPRVLRQAILRERAARLPRRGGKTLLVQAFAEAGRAGCRESKAGSIRRCRECVDREGGECDRGQGGCAEGRAPAPLWRPRIRGDGATRAIPRFFGRRVARYADGAPRMGAPEAGGDVAAVRASGGAHRGQAVARAPAGARVVRCRRRRRRGRVEARARRARDRGHAGAAG
jgi:superfamily II DNA or RNA helicase